MKRDCLARRAAVAAGKPEAVQAGVDILRRGGSPADAAAAVGFALGVADPGTSGIGGGGFITIKTPRMPHAEFIDFRERAPRDASAGMWNRDSSGAVVNRENILGAKSVAVPGEVAGLAALLERHGTMTLAEVLEPSIRLAEDGVTVTPMFRRMVQENMANLKKSSDTSRIFLNRGRPPAAGERFRNPELGMSLRRIAEEGASAFYSGEIAHAVVSTVRKHGGVLSRRDLADYRVEFKAPAEGCYRGYSIISSPPPSSGGSHIIQALNILETFDIARMELNSHEYLHLFSEVFKQVYADRARYMADTNFVDVPVKGILSKEYAGSLAERIDPNHSRNLSCFDPWTFEHRDTTHYSVGDREGSLIAVTKTINHFFGSALIAEGTGILLNNSMADFSVNRGHVNTVEPRKKPLSTMAPTILLKDGMPFAILGSPGGERIINVVTQVISRLIDHELTVQRAVDCPRITQNTSDPLCCEADIPLGVREKLQSMGHRIGIRPRLDRGMGGVHALLYSDESMIQGGADPRRDGIARGID